MVRIVNNRASVKGKLPFAALTPCFEVDVQSIHGIASENREQGPSSVPYVWV